MDKTLFRLLPTSFPLLPFFFSSAATILAFLQLACIFLFSILHLIDRLSGKTRGRIKGLVRPNLSYFEENSGCFEDLTGKSYAA